MYHDLSNMIDFQPFLIDAESLATSFSNVVTLLSYWKTNAKFGSIDGGFVASVIGGGVGVDCYGGGVKDGNDCGMTVVNIGEDSVITVRSIKRVLVV
ncbi:hypothetical protein Tco_0323390 [Tanacetum coccineum]